MSESFDVFFQYPRCWIVSSDWTDVVLIDADLAFQYPRCWIVSSDWDDIARGFLRPVFQYPRCWIVSSDCAGGAHPHRTAGTFSILAVGSFPQTKLGAVHHGVGKIFQYPRCWIVSSGSFPQTNIADALRSINSIFQYPRCWIVSSDTIKSYSRPRPLSFQYPRCWIVSSDAERCAHEQLSFVFQYPRCWIVSSDLKGSDAGTSLKTLSVSSLLDRFLRPAQLRCSHIPTRPFSILAVGSFPQTTCAA